RHQEIARAAGAVAGEHAARSVRAVRGGCEPDDEQPRAWIAEPWHRSSPVCVVAERASLLASDALAVGAQTRATIARHDRAVHVDQGPGVQLVVGLQLRRRITDTFDSV